MADWPVLRVELRGEALRGLCSPDGQRWYQVGRIDLTADGPLLVGVCAIGMIDRTVYLGAFPEGTEISFSELSFERY